jgi:hypothetical protein
MRTLEGQIVRRTIDPTEKFDLDKKCRSFAHLYESMSRGGKNTSSSRSPHKLGFTNLLLQN